MGKAASERPKAAPNCRSNIIDPLRKAEVQQRGLVITRTPVLLRLFENTRRKIGLSDPRRDQYEIANMRFLEEFLLRLCKRFKRIDFGQ